MVTDTELLYRIDVNTGELSYIGSARNYGATSPRGLTTIDGVLYMLDSFPPAIYTVSTEDASATRIGTATNFGVGETSPAL